MNKRKLRRVAIVALVLVLLCNTLGVQAGTTKKEPDIVVSGYWELINAVNDLDEGSIIGIKGTIEMQLDTSITGKYLIIRRMEPDAKLVFNKYRDDLEGSSTIGNIVFDGNATEVGGTAPFIEVNHSVSFKACSFKECYNQSGNGGVFSVNNKDLTLTDCTFEGNSAGNGSHVYNDTAGTVSIEVCKFRDGWADELGGAIYNRGTLTVKDTEIKENNARIGGGIYNSSSLEVDNSLIWSNTATVQGTDIANEGTYTNSTTEEQFDSLLKYYKLYYAGWEDDTNTSVGGSGDYLKFLTATEKPTKPDPTEPVDPDPSEPSTPDPTDPVTPPSGGDEGKTDPEPTDPTPTEPTDPAPTDPEKPDTGDSSDPEPTDPKPTEPDKPDTTEPSTEDPQPSTPSNADQTGGGDTITDNSDHSTTTSTIDNSQHNSTTNSSSSVGVNTTNSSSVSNTDNSRSESSRMENSNNSSTVNNYYQQDKQEPATASTNASQPVNVTVPVTVSTPEAKGSDTATTEAPESTSIADKNINIEAKGVDVKLEITGDSYNISISAPEGQESQIQPVNEVSTVNTPESTTEPQRSPNWIEYITVILLAVLVGLEIKDKLHKEK